MIDLVLGYMAGCLTIAIVWKMTAECSNVIVVQQKDGQYVVTHANKAVKPDNAKARHYSSPEYRNEMAFVREMNKNREGV